MSERYEIDDDKWVPLPEINGRQGEAVSIDHFLGLVDPFWHALEVHCVPACCGIDALSFRAEDIFRARNEVDPTTLACALGLLRQMAESHPSEIFLSKRLNNYFHRQTLVPLLQHIQEHAVPSPTA